MGNLKTARFGSLALPLPNVDRFLLLGGKSNSTIGRHPQILNQEVFPAKWTVLKVNGQSKLDGPSVSGRSRVKVDRLLTKSGASLGRVGKSTFIPH